jgi:CheY-like chemotaxis protein
MSNPNLKPHIYVVDDSTELGEMLEVFLNRAGYPTRVFNDPMDALAALGSSDPKPDLLVSDFHMPGINGLELIHRSRMVHPTLKIIAASAHILDEELEKYPVQPDRILPKQYTTAELLQMVHSLLAE